MTNDIEGKVNEMGHTGECQEGCQCVLAKMKSKSSPNTKPLNEKRDRTIDILNHLKKTIPNCKFNPEVFQNEGIFLDAIDYAILSLTTKPLDEKEVGEGGV